MCSGTCGTCYQCQDTCNCTPIPYVDSPIDKIDAEGVIYNMDTNCSTSKLMCFFGIRNGTNLKTILEKLDEKLCQVRGLFDEKVKITVDDTSEGYLFDKLIVGNCITKTIVTVAGNQKLQLGIDCNCVKNCIDDTPSNCFVPVYGNPLRICNGANTTVQISTINTGTTTVQFSTNEGLTWVDGTPNTYTFNFPSNGSLQKIKARLKGCTQYADGFVSLCTVNAPTSPVNPPITPIAPTPVTPTPVVPTAPTTPVSPTPVFVPVTPIVTPTTPIAPTPVPVVPSPTPVTPTPVGCISVSNFDYTINGNANANGFTVTGVQDINITVTGYAPSGANTPIFYEYILDGFSSGVISSNSKNFPSVNIGNHTLSIITYNCSGSITKNINFAISNTTIPVAPTTVPTAPSSTPMYYSLVRCDGSGTDRSIMNITGLSNGTVVKLSDNNCYTITGTSSTVTTNIISSVQSNCSTCLGSPPVVPSVPTTPTIAPICNQISNLQITGSSTVSENGTGSYGFTFSGTNNITSINWSVSGTETTILSGSNSSTVNLQFGNEPGFIFLQVVSCGISLSTSFEYGISSTPVAPAYNKCNNNIYMNAADIVCNGDGTTTFLVSVDGENGETVEFSINAEPYVVANSGNSGYTFTVPSNGNAYAVSARIVGCTNNVTDTVQSCTITPIACIPITDKFIGGQSSAFAGETVTFDASYLPLNASTPVFYDWNTSTNSDIIIGSAVGSSVNVIFSGLGGVFPQEHYINCVIWNSCTVPFAITYPITILEAP